MFNITSISKQKQRCVDPFREELVKLLTLESLTLDFLLSQGMLELVHEKLSVLCSQEIFTAFHKKQQTEFSDKSLSGEEPFTLSASVTDQRKYWRKISLRNLWAHTYIPMLTHVNMSLFPELQMTHNNKQKSKLGVIKRLKKTYLWDRYKD